MNRMLIALVGILWVVAPLRAADVLSGRLPPSGTWEAAGVTGGIPTNRTNLINVTQAPYNVDNTGATSAVSGINSAITAAAANDVVYLPAGTYKIDGQLTIAKNNVTLRGHGMDTILVASGSTPTILAGHSSSWQSHNQAITGGDYAVGSTTFSVASTTGFTVGQMVRVWQENNQDANAPVIDVNASQTMQAQITILTGKTSNSLTVSPAIVFPITGTLNPEIYYNSTTQSGIGIEDLYIDASAKTGNYTVELNGTIGSWIKNVKSYKSNGYHFYLNYAVNCEVRHCYLDDLQNPQNNNAGVKCDSVGSSLIIDNIFYRQFPAIQINGQPVAARTNAYVGGGSAGNVIAYNYILNSPNVSGSGLMGYAIVSDHGAHNTFNLYEGNIGCKFVQDGWYGSDTYDTVVRNWWLGTDPASDNMAECVTLNRFTRYASVVGNLLGTNGYTFTYDALEANNPGNSIRYIYRLGYPYAGNRSYTGTAQPSVGDWWADYGTAAGYAGFLELDRDVATTLLRKGNYNTQDAAIPASEALGGDTIADSYFLSGVPSNWGGLTWPAFDPNSPNFSAAAIPAGYRYTYGVDPPPAAIAPSGLSASQVSTSSLSLSWTDNSAGVDTFSVERSLNGTTGWSVVATPAASVVTYTDTGLASNTAYYYRVRAVSGTFYSAYTSNANATTGTPPIVHPGVNPSSLISIPR